MRKTHFRVNGNAVCGNGRSTSENIFAVDCGNCERRPEFIAAKDEAMERKREAFMAQEPRRVSEPWRNGHMVCNACGNDLFRIGDRTCYGHYQDYVCADCGHAESRLTETGMAF